MTTDTDPATGRAHIAHEGRGRAVVIARLAIGLAQGLALWWLVRAAGEDGADRVWPATRPLVFGPMFLVAAYLPAVLLAGVCRLRLKTLLIWPAVAAVLLALLAWHDIARRSSGETQPFISMSLMAFGAAALFIAHHLVAPADIERRRVATYAAYFDTAWKAGVQLALSVGFTGAFWLLLWLGASLFQIIGIRLLNDLLGESWFSIPVLSLAFALAVHLTDVRDGLIRGVRTVALMLLSWLLLVLTVLVAGFLLALPFTGLDGLWKTGSATALVLGAAGTVVILINAAYQDGLADNLPPVALRIAVRIAAVLLTPLVLIAVWGLTLRIGQHGLTPDRIIACACTLVGAAYAAGYGFAALIPLVRKRDWMQPLERTNIAVAALTVVIILALFSPVADPARLSVADQTHRLASGRITPDRFDYAFLRFDSGKAGEAALAALARSSDDRIASAAKRMQAVENRYDLSDDMTAPRLPVIAAWPTGSTLPDGFVVPVPQSDARHGCEAGSDCLATAVDLNGDGAPEVLLANSFSLELYAGGQDGAWLNNGSYRPLNCDGEPSVKDPRDAMRAGLLRPVATQWPDLSFGGTPAQLSDNLRCRRVKNAAR